MVASSLAGLLPPGLALLEDPLPRPAEGPSALHGCVGDHLDPLGGCGSGHRSDGLSASKAATRGDEGIRPGPTGTFGWFFACVAEAMV